MNDRSAAQGVATFVARYEPAMVERIQGCRARMHALIPMGCELVYDNYNALVFAYAPRERTSEALVSLAAYPRWVTLFFLHGKRLPDPHGLLEGSGSQVRGIRLKSSADLDRPEVLALLRLALQVQAEAYAQADPLRVVIKSVAARQRPRRPVGPH